MIIAPVDPTAAPPADDQRVLTDIRALIAAGRGYAAQAINSVMVVTYWNVGDRIRREVVGQERAEYGKRLIARLAEDLTREYGAGFSRTNLFNMLRFAEAFPDFQIVQTLSGQLGWSHVNQLISISDPLAREFYARMCVTERWSVRTLRKKIQGLLFERTAISKMPEA
ncbi:MAG TPA: DUF1016 N-terminal domain-containing protein, partial [Longimicrobium sp.]|nr:DUF1016 N-terminal domain-containing protein [Longimicrobium sp.]